MNKNKKIICFDIDGTICTHTKGDYSKAILFKEAKNKINSLYNKGYKIIFFTSRYMNRYNGNRDLIYKEGYDFTYKQLIDWGLKFHELHMCKPLYDKIYDDKSYKYNKQWMKSKIDE